MPTYEFRLPDGTIIERSFKISEVPEEIPNPNGEGTAQRIISGGAALVFKGSGFYLTDYGRNAHRTQGDPAKPTKEGAGAKDGSGSAESASTPKADSASAGGGATESKPAATPKPESKPAPPSGPAAS